MIARPTRGMWGVTLGLLAIAAAASGIRSGWIPPSAHAAEIRPGRISASARERAAATETRPDRATPAVYSLTGRIRPLLFWIGKDNVGEARIAWLGGEDGRRGYELLIGSDPKRAPRKINRWGYIAETGSPAGVQVLGFMTEVDDETLEQAKAGVESTQPGSRPFKVIQGTIGPGEATTTVLGVMMSDELTYHDIEAVKQGLPASSAPPRTISVPAGTEPGFLFAMASLLHESVETFRRTGSVPSGATCTATGCTTSSRSRPGSTGARRSRAASSRTSSRPSSTRKPGRAAAGRNTAWSTGRRDR